MTNRTIRFSQAYSPLSFEKCANDHLFEANLCPIPWVNAELLKDYIHVNNISLTITPTPELGVTGGDEENGTSFRLLALNETDFCGFDLSYVPERLSSFGYSVPITYNHLVAVVKNPANASYRICSNFFFTN